MSTQQLIGAQMELSNRTRNQHFVSQAEQRLNCIDPAVSKINQRIYAFDIIDRDLRSIKNISKNGLKIKNNMAAENLFTFSKLDEKLQENYEDLFGRYEANIGSYTKSLLIKIDDPESDIKSEIINVFALKMLNSFRNPYCIKKTLKTLELFAQVVPIDPVLARIHQRVLQSTIPKEDSYLQALEVTREEYDTWMDVLFLLLMKPDGELNIFESIIKNLLECNTLLKHIAIYNFSGEEPGVLISDRSFVEPSHDDFHLAYFFNLSSRAFMFFSAVDIESQTWAPMSIEAVEAFEKRAYPIRVIRDTDNFDMLSIYNATVIKQCFRKVFCSVSIPYGVDCVS